MRQILLDLHSGTVELAAVPAPMCRASSLLIRTTRTLISAGTERKLVEFGKGSLLAKARSEPEKVKLVLDKIRTDGLMPTLETVFRRLDEPMPLGFCNVGVVVDVGAGVTEFRRGDRVAGNAPHAEIVCVPKNLCAKIPDEVSDEQATFAVLSSFALEGVRLINPALGENFVVFGLGLIGLLSVQLLLASGCGVLGVDIKAERLILAERYGARTFLAGASGDPVIAARAWTQGKGVDGVLIAATAKSSEVIHEAAQMCRKRGRIVLIGDVGLNLRRSDFYEKELTFQLSCSSGPGRYDDQYEQLGVDYPYGFVRWTEQRNLAAALEAIQAGQLRVDELITHRFPLSDAPVAYEKVRTDRHALGVLLGYPAEVQRSRKITVVQQPAPAEEQVVVGVIGAGNFARSTLMPALSKTDARVAYVAARTGAAPRQLANKFGVDYAVTDYRLILQDPGVNAVIIAVGHDLHARLLCESLAAGKHVFVEKPLAIDVAGLSQILTSVAKARGRHIMVGFNRRFSPHTVNMKQLLAGRTDPLCMAMTVNAGHIPPEHWIHDPTRGGGRIIGEACHFVDLMVHLAESPVKTVAATMMGGTVGLREDKMSLTLGFEDGSVGTVSYFANGPKSYPKEVLEVFSDGRVLRLENFRRLRGYGFRGFRKFRTLRQDKGHPAEFAAFVDRVSCGGAPLIPIGELLNVTLATFAAVTSAKEVRTVVMEDEYGDILSGSVKGIEPP